MVCLTVPDCLPDRGTRLKRKIKMICNRICEESSLKNISAPYDNDGLKLQLKHAFGDTTLNQISKNVPSSIALAVTTPVSLNAKTFFNNMLQFDFKNLVHTSFDTFMSKKDASANVLVKDVLLATSAAPTYLPIPIHIRSYADEDGFGYIDGGVGANCPLRLALRRIG
jgi:patatin-like phospholipase/acyl hydrolase